MITLIAAAGAAAAMYYFDPESGERRRALLRDKFAWMKDEFGDVRTASEGKIEHISNVAKGLAHESGIKKLTPKEPETSAALHASAMSGAHESHQDTQRDTSQPSNRAA